jgi:hypothetical protein
LFYAASALLKLQQMYGLIPRIQVRYASRATCFQLQPVNMCTEQRCNFFCCSSGMSFAITWLHGALCFETRRNVVGFTPLLLQGKGPEAEAVMKMAVRMRREDPLPAAAAATCRIHRAVLLDREVDPITPMVTQITFEGLIDEVTGIKHGSAPYTPSR